MLVYCALELSTIWPGRFVPSDGENMDIFSTGHHTAIMLEQV